MIKKNIKYILFFVFSFSGFLTLNCMEEANPSVDSRIKDITAPCKTPPERIKGSSSKVKNKSELSPLMRQLIQRTVPFRVKEWSNDFLQKLNTEPLRELAEKKFYLKEILFFLNDYNAQSGNRELILNMNGKLIKFLEYMVKILNDSSLPINSNRSPNEKETLFLKIDSAKLYLVNMGSNFDKFEDRQLIFLVEIANFYNKTYFNLIKDVFKR